MQGLKSPGRREARGRAEEWQEVGNEAPAATSTLSSMALLANRRANTSRENKITWHRPLSLGARERGHQEGQILQQDPHDRMGSSHPLLLCWEPWHFNGKNSTGKRKCSAHCKLRGGGRAKREVMARRE